MTTLGAQKHKSTVTPLRSDMAVAHQRVPERYQKCRFINHPFDVWAGDTDWHPTYGNPVSYLCSRCGMIRRDIYDIWGDPIYRRYIQPDGYHMERDLTPTRSEIRLDYLGLDRPGDKRGTKHLVKKAAAG